MISEEMLNATSDFLCSSALFTLCLLFSTTGDCRLLAGMEGI
jgi:hypothetical protein